MLTTLILAIALAAVAAAGKDLPAMLLAPVTNSIRFVGKTIEDLLDKIERFFNYPEPPNLVGFVLATLCMIGAMSWISTDSLCLAFGFQILIPDKTISFLSLGNTALNKLMLKYIYIGIAVSVTLSLSILVHHLYLYLEHRFPERIAGITALMNIFTVLALLISLGYLRYHSTNISNEISQAIATKEYSMLKSTLKSTGLLAMIIYWLGVLASGNLWFLGFTRFILMGSQLIAGALIIPLTCISFVFMLLNKLTEGIEKILMIPVAFMDNIFQFIRFTFKPKEASYKILFILLVILSSLVLQGCIKPEKPKVIVTIVDLSASFNPEKDNTIVKLNNILDCIEPEDCFYFICIAEKSFSDKNLLYINQHANTSEIQDNLDYYKRKDSLKESVSSIIKGHSAKRTDVLGAFYRAQVIFEDKGNDYDKYLIIFSDLSDNVNKSAYNIRLDSVDVLALFAGTDKADFKVAYTQNDKWQDILSRSNAKSVLIYGHDLSISCDIVNHLNKEQ